MMSLSTIALALSLVLIAALILGHSITLDYDPDRFYWRLHRLRRSFNRAAPALVAIALALAAVGVAGLVWR
jgi:hypothetical protein